MRVSAVVGGVVHHIYLHRVDCIVLYCTVLYFLFCLGHSVAATPGNAVGSCFERNIHPCSQSSADKTPSACLTDVVRRSFLPELTQSIYVMTLLHVHGFAVITVRETFLPPAHFTHNVNHTVHDDSFEPQSQQSTELQVALSRAWPLSICIHDFAQNPCVRLPLLACTFWFTFHFRNNWTRSQHCLSSASLLYSRRYTDRQLDWQ